MEKAFDLIDFLLADGICNIIKDTIKKILERTEGHKSARERLIVSLFSHCILILMDNRYNRDEKIYRLKEESEDCINVIDAFIETEKEKEDKKNESGL